MMPMITGENQEEQFRKELDELRKKNEELCALAAERTRIEEMIKRRLEFEKTVSMISARFLGDCDIDNAIEQSLQEMAVLRNAVRAYIFMFSEDGALVSNTHEWCAPDNPPQKEKMQNLPTNFFVIGLDKLRRGEPVHIKTASKLPSESDREALEKQGIKSLLLLPLRLNQSLAGFIGFDSAVRTTEWTEDDVSILRVASEVIGRAIERKKQDSELAKQMHNLSILYDVGRALNFIDDLTKLLKMILDRAIDIAQSQKGSLMLYDENTDELVVRVVRGLDSATEERILHGEIQCVRIKPGDGIAGRVFESGQPLIINNTREDTRFIAPMDSYVANILCVPLRVFDETIGVINITNKKNDEPFNENDVHIVAALSNQAAVAINNARLYELAVTDSITKLLIRRHFMQRLEDEVRRAKRYGHKFSLVMVDFDHFKEINDTYGHPAGDKVLMDVGRIFKKFVRSSDFVGRYGGEEFSFALPETGLAGASVFCERLRKKIEDYEFTYKDILIRKTISLGIATFPDHADDMQELIRRADLSLYKAKRDGRNKSCSFDDVMRYEKAHNEEPA
ncbi:MAG: diguanylate cyclase [Candidatus Eremiobacteraeota bacterium]|nr:diguanylate cyclase [Candidatus Eremiobacteraeota bacterium]